MSNYITTYTRRHFDPVNPEPADMDIKDIAHALSMICRGNGHVSSFWSVGEHYILCAKEAAAKGYADRLVYSLRFYMMQASVICQMCQGR